MKTYKLRSVVRRGSMLGAAFVVAAAAFLPVTSTYADALNPLTDRSLTLSSGSPGWAFTDGSGNATYAPPNSGANGQKTGNTFSFKVSTDTTGVGDKVEAITFQYCTKSAGSCLGPGDIPFLGSPGSYTRDTNNATQIAAQKSDLEIVSTGSAQVEQANLGTYVNTTTGNVTSIPAPGATDFQFIVMRNVAGTWTSSDDWVMTTQVAQYGSVADGQSTGKMNQITLVNETGEGFSAGQEVKIVFFATNTNYITNPGSKEFFVKINTYKEVNNTVPTAPVVSLDDVIDGGVTVANVMNQSIHITTKVLETMDFSVGTVDPYTLEALEDEGDDEDEDSQLYAVTGNVKHGACDPIVQGMAHKTNPSNTLQLGDELSEFSLETAHTYSTHSYWRLSSNSSAGATIYYSGVTLYNTVGDFITPINNGNGVKTAPQRGMEQFGLAMANNTAGVRTVNYNIEREPEDDGDYGIFEGGADNLAAGLSDALSAGIHASVTDDDISDVDGNASWHPTGPQLYPIAPLLNYSDGAGNVNIEYGSVNTQFAFDSNSNTIPAPFAQGTEVVDCVTGKMRYIANIAATTPAGIYTTKINYIAAPQY